MKAVEFLDDVVACARKERDDVPLYATAPAVVQAALVRDLRDKIHAGLVLGDGSVVVLDRRQMRQVAKLFDLWSRAFAAEPGDAPLPDKTPLTFLESL
jgi:hypothetical protein